MLKIDNWAIEKRFLEKGLPLKNLLKISLDLFEARQTGILYGTNHTKLKFLPTIMWDRGILDRFDGRGLKGLILKLFGPWVVTKRKLSPVFFHKTDVNGDLKENDGIIAYILRNYADYYTKGIRIIICPDTANKTRGCHEQYLRIPFFVYNGNHIMPAEEEVRFDVRIIRHFNSENSIYIYLPDFGILVINTADNALLEMQGQRFLNEEELIKRLNVLMSLVEASSLAYLGRVKGKKGAALLWRKEKHLRQASRDLIENEGKYRDLYENAPIAYFSMDPKGNILHCNRKAEILSGYDGNELLGKNVIELFSGQTGADAGMADIRECFARGRPVTDMEFLMTPSGGDAFAVSLSVESSIDNSGRILEFRAMVLDISRRKSLEKQLLKTQKMQTVGTVAGGIAHDFNNILSPISGYTETLLMETKPDDPAKEPLEIILDCVSHAKELVSRMLTFSRQKVHEQKRIRLEDVAKDSITLVRSFLPAAIQLKGSTDRVLLVDDDKKVALMQTHMMEKLGYTVTCFTNSREAFNHYKNDPDLFDVVVTDMTMPELTGIQLAKKIYDIRPDIPVIICTGLGDAMDGNKLDTHAVKRFLKKPVSVGDLSFTLKQVLAESASIPNACNYISQKPLERA